MTDDSAHDDPRKVATTLAAVNWDLLAEKACQLLQAEVSSANWGRHTSGAFNLVRFLHVGEDVIVARIPLEWDPELPCSIPRRQSEVATMEYIKEHTKIPIPRVLQYSHSHTDIGRPYILMTNVDGVALSSIWDDLADEKREKVLGQVVEILLDLSEQRFSQIGALFRRKDSADQWEIRSESEITPTAMDTLLYRDSVSYWTASATKDMNNISETNFGAPAKEYEYAQAWFMRSCVPELYDARDDLNGFPVCPGDFHSQNIMVDDDLQITGIIDWEGSGTFPQASFAIHPFFIQDHPMWDDDHLLRKRNVRDQATFNRLMRIAESERSLNGSCPLSDAFETSRGRYLFQQGLHELLFKHIFEGDQEDEEEDDQEKEKDKEEEEKADDEEEEEEESFSVKFYWALMEHSILKHKSRQFERETQLAKEVRAILGVETLPPGIDKARFREIVVKYHVDLSDLDLKEFQPE
ncbi:hypothetical protein C8J56DRAFT_812763 [Mycena floridula]|nr:hypothetical protein C8J56DRAFT_812763 [Mycena floridula]